MLSTAFLESLDCLCQIVGASIAFEHWCEQPKIWMGAGLEKKSLMCCTTIHVQKGRKCTEKCHKDQESLYSFSLPKQAEDEMGWRRKIGVDISEAKKNFSQMTHPIWCVLGKRHRTSTFLTNGRIWVKLENIWFCLHACISRNWSWAENLQLHECEVQPVRSVVPELSERGLAHKLKHRTFSRFLCDIEAFSSFLPSQRILPGAQWTAIFIIFIALPCCGLSLLFRSRCATFCAVHICQSQYRFWTSNCAPTTPPKIHTMNLSVHHLRCSLPVGLVRALQIFLLLAVSFVVRYFPDLFCKIVAVWYLQVFVWLSIFQLFGVTNISGKAMFGTNPVYPSRFAGAIAHLWRGCGCPPMTNCKENSINTCRMCADLAVKVQEFLFLFSLRFVRKENTNSLMFSADDLWPNS